MKDGCSLYSLAVFVLFTLLTPSLMMCGPDDSIEEDKGPRAVDGNLIEPPLSSTDHRSAATEGDERGGSWVDTFSDPGSVHSSDGVVNVNDVMALNHLKKQDLFEGNTIDMVYWTQLGEGPYSIVTSPDPVYNGSQSAHFVQNTAGKHNGLRRDWSPATKSGRFSVWAWDNDGSCDVALRVGNGPASGSNQQWYVLRMTDGSYYTSRDFSRSVYENTWVQRTPGWHKLEFRVDSSGTTPYIDGVQAFNTFAPMTSLTHIQFYAFSDSGSQAWFDDFEIREAKASGWVNSTSLDRPGEMAWDALHVGSVSGFTSTMKVSLLDGTTRQPLSGYTDIDVIADPEIDISGVEASSIALRGYMGTTAMGGPFLPFWGVSYNASSAWRDALFGGTKLEVVPASFEALNGGLSKTSDFGQNEVVRTTAIDIPGGFRPDSLTMTKTDNPSARIYTTVLDGLTDQPIEGFSDIEEADIDLSGMDFRTRTKLKLEARFDASPGQIPVLEDWSVAWVYINAPKIEPLPEVGVEEDSHVEHALDLSQYATSPVQDSRELTYVLADVSADWADVYIKDDHYLGVDATVTPDSNSDTHGSITATVTAVDDAGTDSLAADLTVIIKPVNDEPYPDVDIPDIFVYEGGEDDSVLLSSEMYFRDVELDKIHYSAKVDPLEEYEGEEGNMTVSIDPVSSKLVIRALKDFHTGDGAGVPVWVYADDDPDMNTVDSGFLQDGSTPNWTHQEVLVTVLNVNDPPVWEPVPKFVMDEDEQAIDVIYLADHVTDIDNDVFDLRFELVSSTYDRIGVAITDDGWVSAEPEENVWGEARIKVEVTDGTDDAAADFTVEVRPVNDLPVVEIEAPAPDEAVGGSVEISGTAFDVENALEYVELHMAPTSYPGTSRGTRFISEPATIKAEGLDEWHYRWDTTPLVNGEWRITARAFDGAAFSVNETAVVYVDNPRNRPPTVLISSHSSGAAVPPGLIELSGTSSDPDGLVELVQVSLGGNTTWAPCMADAVSGAFEKWSYTLDASNYAGQNLTVFARAYDGSLYSSETAITLTVRAPAPVDGEDGNGGGEDGGEGGDGINSAGKNTATQNLMLILVVVIVAVFVVLALVIITNRNKKKRDEEEEARRRDGEALRADIIKPGAGPSRLRATPAEIVGAPTVLGSTGTVSGTLSGATIGSTARSPPGGAGDFSPGAASTASNAPGPPGAAQPAETLGGAQPVTPEHLLPPAMAAPVERGPQT